MSWRGRIAIVIAWMAWSLALQFWSMIRAPVPALDAVRFVSEAQQIAHVGLQQYLRADGRRPLYPALVYGTHRALTAAWGERPTSWIRSAQVVSVLAATLSLIPVFGIARCLVGTRGAIIATGLFASLPVVARAGADAVADSVHLLFISLAVWALLAALTAASPATSPSFRAATTWRWLSAGAALAVALLSRPDAVVVFGALAVALVIASVLAQTQWSVVRAGGSLVLVVSGAALVLLPVASFRAGPASSRLARSVGLTAPTQEYAILNARDTAIGRTARTSTVDPPLAVPVTALALKEPTTSLRFAGFGAATKELLHELTTALFGLTMLLSAVGAWRCRSQLLGAPAHRFATIVLLGLAASALAAATKWGYLSTRHLLPLVPVAVALAASGVVQVSQWVARLSYVLRSGDVSSATPISTTRVQAAIAALAILICVGKLLSPAHASHRAHREAATWLATAAPADARVLDSRGWTALFTRLPTYRYHVAAEAYADPALSFVVVEQEELEFDSSRSRGLSELLATHAEPVATFGPPDGRKGDIVAVYRWWPRQDVARRGRDVMQPPSLTLVQELVSRP